MLPYINYPFEGLSNATGARVDDLKLIGSFLLSYPLAGVLKRIPDSKPERKNAFIIGISLFYLVGLFDLWDGIRTLLISSAGAYIIAWKIDGGFMPWIAFVFLMGHMSISHIYRQYVNPPDLFDITGAQMVLVMKLSAFCWNIRDGQMPLSELNDFQKERRLTSLPPILDYAGYVLFFPSLFAGPAFDYIDYSNWLSTSMFTPPAGVNPSALPPTRKKRRIPRSGRPAAMKAAQGLGWIFLYLKFSSWYSSSLVLGPTYLTYSFVHRVFVLYLFGFTTRLKYYGVWTLTEGACILSGLGYSGINPQTGRYNWSRLQNVAPYPLETAQNTRAYLDAWNQNTNAWLKNYIYLRVTPKGSKPGFGATMATFITSAFWHGFYPGYYLAFILAAFLQTVAKTFRRSIRPFFLVPGSSSIPLRSKKYYDFASYLTTQLAFSFTVSAFILLDFSSCMIVWTRVYWYTPIGVALSMAFFATPAVKVEIAKRLKARAARAPPKTVPPASMSSSSIANTPATIPSSAEGLLRLDLSRTSSINTDAGDGTPGSGGYAYSGALGVPGDPEQFVDDAVREARAQVEEVRRRQKQQRQQGQKEGSSKGDGGIGGMVGDGS